MGWRLFKRIRIAPGLGINVSRSGLSLSVGPRGFKKTFGPRGVRTTVGLPGTGVYHTDLEPWPTDVEDGRLRCPACHRIVAKSASFCAHCGAALTE